MTAERWQQVKAIFHRAAELDPIQREQYVEETCCGDEELRREVRSLLASDQQPSSFLSQPIITMGAAAVSARIPVNMLGRVVGNYLITGELAHGGMGIVYRARHITLPREVVVKCIRPIAFSQDSRNALQVRFRREAHIQSQLDHPHIVRVYEFFTCDEEYFLVMEYVPGLTLRSILDQHGVMSAERASALAIQALDGLTHAHSLPYVDEAGNTGVGIIHRDIKPSNLLVDYSGNLKLTDFGTVKVLGEDRLTKTGFVLGTVDFMSPEQIRNQPLDARSDLYSLGVTLYEMLTGRAPFPTDIGSEYDTLKAHIETDPPPIQTLNPEISSSLSNVVMRSLNREPSQRWQTAAEFREALMSCQKDRVGMPASVPLPLKPDSESKVKRLRATLAASFAVLALLAAAVAGVFWLRPSGETAKTAVDQASIAVLPFVDMSPDKNQEYFSDGLTEELTNELAKTPGLRVTGRTSSFQFKGKSEDLREIGSKLKVTAILEGSVRKQGNRARITTQLIKVSDGFHLWSESYEREMTDIFAVQEDIARAVASALKVRLLAVKQAPNSTNTEAYNAYLQGRYFMERSNDPNLQRAVAYFEQSIKLDPGYRKGVGRACAISNPSGGLG